MEPNAYEESRSEQVGADSTLLQRSVDLNVFWCFSFKLDRRTVTNGRVSKRKPRASLSKCLIRIRGVKFQTHPNGKCLQRLGKRHLQSPRSEQSTPPFSPIIRFRHNEIGSPCEESRTSSTNTSEVSAVWWRWSRESVALVFSLLVQRSIQIKNGRYRLRNAQKKSLSIKKTKNCIYFNRFGKCHRGDQCPFIHDRSRIAVCTQ